MKNWDQDSIVKSFLPSEGRDETVASNDETEKGAARFK